MANYSDKPPRTRIEGNLYYWKLPVCIPIIFNVEAVNSQNEGSVRAARWGGVKPCDYSWKADREKLPRDSWERAPVQRRQKPPGETEGGWGGRDEPQKHDT